MRHNCLKCVIIVANTSQKPQIDQNSFALSPRWAHRSSIPKHGALLVLTSGGARGGGKCPRLPAQRVRPFPAPLETYVLHMHNGDIQIRADLAPTHPKLNDWCRLCKVLDFQRLFIYWRMTL